MWLLFSVGSAFFSDSLLATPSHNPTRSFSAASIISPFPFYTMLYPFFTSAKHWFLSDPPMQNTTPALQHEPAPGANSNALKKPSLVHDCSVTSFLSLLWIYCFILTIKFVFQKQSLLSLLLLLHRQFFHPEELEQSFLYPSNYTLIFYVYCIRCWTKVSSLWDPVPIISVLLNCSFLQEHLKAFSFLPFLRNFIDWSGRL